jgi:hypothetical protein
MVLSSAVVDEVGVGVGGSVVVTVVKEGGMQPLGFLAETVLPRALVVMELDLGCHVGEVIACLARRRAVAQRKNMAIVCLRITVLCWVFQTEEVGMENARLHDHILSPDSLRWSPRKYAAKYYYY